MISYSWKSIPIGLLTSASLALLPNNSIYSKPTGFSLQKGKAVPVQTPEGLLIEAGKSALIHWEDFSIAREEILRITHAGGSGCVVNRVLGATRSEILGQLLSNGSVYLINPNGILIGKDAFIDTAGFIGSTLDFLGEDLVEKTMRFQGESDASVVNEGTIHCRIGDVFLIGRKVENSGEIITENGRQGLLSGFDVLVRPNDAPKVQIRSEQLIDAKTFAENPYALAIRHSGKSRTGDKQAVYFSAADGLTEVFGEVTSPGGTVHVLGDVVRVDDQAVIDVSHDAGGGTILVGGDYQGKNPEVLNALVTYFGKEATLKGDALQNGDGAKVILWGDEALRAYGQVSVRGGEFGGDGGLVEASSHGFISINGLFADRRAPMGKAGTLLLDPCNVSISNTATTNEGFAANTYTPTGVSPANILNTELETNLGAGNVTVITTGGCGEAGTITVSNSVTWATANTLTLTAERDIVISADITNTNNGSSFIAMNFTGQGTVTGAVTYNGITLNGGTTVSALTGAIIMAGTTQGTSGDQHGIIAAGTTISTTTGSITLTGTANSAGSNNVNGISTSTLIQSTSSGTVTLTGNANTSGTGIGVYFGGGRPEGGTITVTGVSTASGSNSDGVSVSALALGLYGPGTRIIFTNCTGGSGATSHGVRPGGPMIFQGSTEFTNCTGGSGSGSFGVSMAQNVFVANVDGTTAAHATFATCTNTGTSGGGVNVIANLDITGNLIGTFITTGAGSTNAGWLQSSGITSVGSIAGSITINASSASTGGTAPGISIAGGTMSVAGTGSITLSGTSGPSSGTASGINVSNAVISAVNGSILLTGTARGTADFTQGIVTATATIQTTGSGNITITGTGSSTNNGGLKDGVTLATVTVQATGTGGITFLNCSGGTTSGDKTSGVAIVGSSTIASTAGTVTFDTCTAGTNAGAINRVSAGVSLGADMPGTVNVTAGSAIEFKNITGPGGTPLAGRGVSIEGVSGATNLVSAPRVIATNNITSSATTSGDSIAFLVNNTLISASDFVQIEATATNGGFRALGIYLTANITGVTISATNTVTMTGHATTTSGGTGVGFKLDNAAVAGSTITISGTSAGQGSNSHGAALGGFQGQYTGNLLLATCTGGSGATSHGISIEAGAGLGYSVNVTGGNLIATTNIVGGTGSGSVGYFQGDTVGGGNVFVAGTFTAMITATTQATAGAADGVQFANGTLRAANGAITVTGTSGVSNSSSQGINLNGGSVTTTGSGSITLSGISRGTAANSGILLGATNSFSSATGTINLSGDASASTGSDSRGFSVGASVGLTTNTTAPVIFTNCIGGSSPGTSCHGIVWPTNFTTAGDLTATNNIQGGTGSDSLGFLNGGNVTCAGQLRITASTQATAGNADGIRIVGGAYIVAGTATFNGTSGVTASQAYGYNMTGGSISTSATGASIFVSGSASGTGPNRGVGLRTTNPLTAGTGQIQVSGTSTSSGTNSHGVDLTASWTTSTTGTVSFIGCSGGSGSSSHGVNLGATFSTGGSALFATCSAGSSSTCYGVNIASPFSATSNVTFATITTPNATTTGGAILVAATTTIGGNLLATTNIKTGTGSGNTGVTFSATTTVTGNVDVTAENASSAGGGNGILFSAGTLSTTSTPINLTGLCSDATNAGAASGVNIAGGNVSSTSGSITFSGTSTANAANSHGIRIATQLTTNTSGTVTFINCKGGQGSGSMGVRLALAGFTASGPVNFTNCTAGDDGSCFGVDLSATFSTTGNVTFATITTPNTSTSGGAVRNTATVTIGGNLIATMNITTGTGSDNVGWTQNATTTVTGSINIQASSGSTTGAGHGISLPTAVSMSTTAGGTITLTGTGGPSTGASHGVNITGGTNTITTSTGNGPIIISGSASGTTVAHLGVNIAGSQVGVITSTTGSISITGTSTAAVAGSHGVLSANTWSTGTTGTVTFAGAATQAIPSAFPIVMAATFTTGGVLTYSNAVGIGTSIASTNTITSNGTMTFSSTIDGIGIGINALTLNAGAGSVVLNGNVGATQRLASFIIDSGSTALSVGTGVTSIQANSFTVAGTVPTTLNNTGTLTVDTSAFATGSISFGGTINGASAGANPLTLTANATGTVTISGNVGATTRLGNFTIGSGSGNFSVGTTVTSIQANSFTTAGTVPTTLNNTGTLTVDTSAFATGSISFGGTINGASPGAQPLTLTANATGTVTLSANVGGTARLGNFTIGSGSGSFSTGTGITSIAANSFTTAGTVPTTLNNTGTLTVNTSAFATGSISFGGTINGASAGANPLTLTANATGTVTLNGNIGNSVSLGNLTVTSAQAVGFGSSVITVNAAALSIATAVPTTFATAGTLTVTTTGAGGISFGGTLDAPATGNLTLAAGTGPLFFGGNIGTNDPLGNLTVSTGSVVTFGTSLTVNTVEVGSLNIVSPVPTIFAFTGAVTVNASGAGGITFGGNLNGLVDDDTTLNLNAAAGPVTFGGDVGNTAIFAALNINQASTVYFGSGTHTVNVNEFLVDNAIPVVLQGVGSTTINTDFTGPGTIHFTGTIDGDTAGQHGLTLNALASASILIDEDIGATTEIGALSVTLGNDVTFGAGAALIHAASVSTVSSVPAIFTAATTTVNTSDSNGNISFGGAVDGAVASTNNLTLTAGTGAVSFETNVGTTRLGALTVTSASGVALGTNITSVQATSLSIASGIPMTIAHVGTTAIDTSGVLGQSYGGTINATGAGRDLTLTANAGGPITFFGNIGTVGTPLGAFLVANSTGAVTPTTARFQSTVTNVYASSFTISTGPPSSAIPTLFSGTGTTTIDTSAAGGNITFGGTINGETTAGGHNVTLTAGTGSVFFGNTVSSSTIGGTVPLGALSVTSATLVSFLSQTSAITANSLTIASGIPTTIAAGTTAITTSGVAGVSFGGTLNGVAPNAQALTITTTGGGSTTFTDNVGTAIIPLGAVNIASGSTSVIFGSGTHTVDASSLTIASGTAAIFQGTGLTTINTNYGGGGVISFGGTIDGETNLGGHSFVLTAGAGGAVSFGNDIGNSVRLGDISVNSALSVSIAAAVSVIKSNSLTIASAIPTTLVGTGTTTVTTTPTSSTGNVLFGGTLGSSTVGGHNLTITAGTGNVTFGGNIGGALGATRLGALSVTSATLTSFTSGASPFTVFANSVSISSPAQIAETLTTITTTPTSGTGDISFGSTLNGTSGSGQSLTLVAGLGGGNITFTGAVGATNRLNALTITSATNVTASSSISAVTLTQTNGSGISTFNGAIDTTSTTSLTGVQFAMNSTVNASSITFVNSGLLAIAAAGDMTTTSGNFDQSGGGAIQTAGNISSAADIHFTNAITLTGNVNMTAADDIFYDSTIDGTFALTVSGNNITYSGAVGLGTSLQSISTTATSGVITVEASQNVSSGPMTYNGDVVLTTSVQFTDSGAGAVSFATNSAGDAISGPYDTTISATSTSITITGDVNLAGTMANTNGGDFTATGGSGFTIDGDISTIGYSGGGSGGAVFIGAPNGSISVDNISTYRQTSGTGGNIFLAPSADYSGGYPVGLIILNGDLLASDPMAAITASDGEIFLDSNRSSQPTVASIVSSSYPPGNDVSMRAKEITMGIHEAMTILGDLTMEATTMTLSDIVVLEDLTLTATTINLNTRTDVTILDYLGDFYISPTLHFLAGGTYSQTGTLVPATGPLNAGTLGLSPAAFSPLLVFDSHILNYDSNTQPIPTPPEPIIPVNTITNLVYEVGVANSQLSDHSPTYSRDFPPPYYLRKQMPYIPNHPRNFSGFEQSKILNSFSSERVPFPMYSNCQLIEDSTEEEWVLDEEVCLQP